MSDRPWHKRYHSDALTGYMELTLEERGAYTTFLDMLYDRGEPLVDNERLLAGYLGVSLRKYRAIRAALIEKGKLYVNDNGKISNRRFDKEREETLKTSREHAENGKRGGDKKAENAKKDNEINTPDDEGLEENSSYPEVRSQIDPLPNGNGCDPEKKLFEDGKQLLGKSSGGMINKLLKAKGLEEAQSIIDEAKSKQDPREWVGAALREDDDLVAGMAAINRMRERIEANG